jgi:hypothetical protein
VTATTPLSQPDRSNAVGAPRSGTAAAPARVAPRVTSGRWQAYLPDLAAVLLFALLPWLRFWRFFTPYPPDQMTLVEGDFNVEFFPLTRAIGAIVRGGDVPLWNPWSDAGQPLLADPQSALWYPLNWLLPWLVTDHSGASVVLLEAHTVAHLFLAALFMYVLARHVLRSRFGALVAALVFAYSGLLTAYPIQQVPILRTAIWMPLLLLCLIRAFEHPSLRWAVLGGLLLGVDVVAGHPQLLLFQLYGLALYAAFRLWQVWPDRRAMATTVGMFALFGVLGFGLAAVQLIPSYEFMQLSDRATADYAFTAAGYSRYELLLDVIAPRIIGGVPSYLGILPLLLAFLAVRFVRHRLLPYFVLLAVLGLIVSMAGNTFFHSALYLLGPGYALFQHQERAIYLYVLATAMLAGYGATWLAAPLRRGDARALRRLGAAAFAGVLAALVVAGLWYIANLYMAPTDQALRWREVIDWYNWFVFMLLLGLGLIAARRLWRGGRRIVLAALPAAILLDLFTVTWTHDLSPRRPDQVFVASEIVRFVQDQPGLFRVADQNVLNGNNGLVYLLPTINGTYGMFLARFMALKAALPPERLHELLNVRYVLTRQEPAPGARVAREEPFQQFVNRVVEVPNPLPRALIVPHHHVIADEREILGAMAGRDFDPRLAILLSETPASPAPTPAGPGEAVVSRYSATAIDVDVQTTGGYLLLSEMDYPGWRAEVDGVERPILRADYSLRAVALQPGDRQVRFRYEPGSLRLGGAISATALGLAAALLVWGGRRGGFKRRMTGLRQPPAAAP